MVLEIAEIEVRPGMEAEFEAGAAKATELLQRVKGYQGMELHHSIENPTQYRLFVRWATLEDHTVHFRGSPEFQEWRSLIGHCFAGTPKVEHTVLVVKGVMGA